MQYHENGKILSANYFAMWYLTHKSEDMPIPYVKQNIANKLVQLAQNNNREFKSFYAKKLIRLSLRRIDFKLKCFLIYASIVNNNGGEETWILKSIKESY